MMNRIPFLHHVVGFSRMPLNFAAAAVVSAAAIASPPSIAAPPSTQTAITRPPSTQPATVLTAEQKAKLKELSQKGRALSDQWNAAIGDGSVLRDASQHAALRNTLAAIDKSMDDLSQQMRAVLPPSTRPVDPQKMARGKSYGAASHQVARIAVEDDSVIAAAKAESTSTDPVVARLGQFKLLAGQWLGAPDDTARAKATDALGQFAKGADAADPLLASAMAYFLVFNKSASADPALRTAIVAAYPGPIFAKDLARNDGMKPGMDLFAALGGGTKPLVITGTTVDGKSLSTADWKGKVILVDFWATWCGPCKAELPHVKAVYKKYHDQGLEVLGVSDDQSKDALTKFLAADPDLAWPQLFDQKAADKGDPNPLLVRYGIGAIPQMFLIDKNGICRTVKAREQMDDAIPKLLAESASVSMVR